MGRALRLLEGEIWVEQARTDAERLRNENLSTEDARLYLYAVYKTVYLTS